MDLYAHIGGNIPWAAHRRENGRSAVEAPVDAGLYGMLYIGMCVSSYVAITIVAVL